MAKQSAGTHQPLSWRHRLRLNAAIKGLKSRFHAVRIAAHKEIRAILHKPRGLKGWLRAWAANAGRAGVRKVTPRQLHKPLRVQARAPEAPRQAAPAPSPAGPLPACRPRSDHILTGKDFRQRRRDAKAAAKRGQSQPQPQRQPAPQPARKPDAMQQAQDAMRQAHQQPQGARSPGRPGQTAAFTEYTPSASRTNGKQSHPCCGNPDPIWSHIGHSPAESSVTRTPLDVAATPTRTEQFARKDAQAGRVAASQNGMVPPLPGHPEAIRQPQEKGRWAGLRSRLATERSGRSRSRTA